MTRSGKTKKK